MYIYIYICVYIYIYIYIYLKSSRHEKNKYRAKKMYARHFLRLR